MPEWSLLQPRATTGSVITPEEFDFTLPVITLDANLVERHGFKARISKYPVERSADGETRINDHIEPDPDTLVLEGIITNTPIDAANLSKQAARDPSVLDRYRRSYRELKRMARLGTLFNITTGLELYESMAITDISVVRKGNPGFQDIRPVITFEKVRLVSTTTVPIPAQILKPPPPAPPDPPPSSHTSAQTQQNLEKQAAREKTPAAALLSGLADLVTD